MLPIIELIAILAVGYLSAHYLIGKLQSRYFFTSGVEYIILGVLVGPQVTDVMTREVVAQLMPVMSLALGSIGLIAGLQLRLRDLFEAPAEYYRVACLEMLTTFLLLGGAFGLVFWYPLSGGLAGAEKVMAVAPAALVLATTGAVSAQAAIRGVEAHYHARGRLSDLLPFAGWFDSLLGIVLFGLLFCLFHTGETSRIRPLTRTEWAAVSIGFGIALGVLFYLFLGRERSREKLRLALIGIVIFSSGTAYYLNLSPLFINLVLGVMLANTSQIRGRLLEVLEAVEKPLYVVLLVVAGAACELSFGQPWYVVAGLATGYWLLRAAGKYLGGYLAWKSSAEPQTYTRGVGGGLLSQGVVAAAMLVNYQQVYQNRFTHLVAVCVLVSVVLNEFFSPKLMKDLLAGAREIEAAGA
jgi:Kef-type K+ transport system membrane component KefB